MDPERLSDNDVDAAVRRERIHLLQRYREGVHLHQRVPDQIRDERAWLELEKIASKADPKREISNVELLMSVLNCGKSHPKIQNLIDHPQILAKLVLIARSRDKTIFFPILYRFMMFVVLCVSDEDPVPQIIPLMVHDKNTNYLPGMVREVGWEKTLRFLDNLLKVDTRDGLSHQTVFEFLLQHLSYLDEREGRELSVEIAKRLLLVVSLADSKPSFIRLAIPEHNYSFWGERVISSLGKGGERPQDRLLLDLLFSLLQLKTCQKDYLKEASQFDPPNKSQSFVVEAFKGGSLPVLTLLKGASGIGVPLHVSHLGLKDVGAAVEFLYLLCNTGHLIHSHGKKGFEIGSALISAYFLDIVQTQAQHFVTYLEKIAIGEAPVLIISGIPAFGLAQFFLQEVFYLLWGPSSPPPHDTSKFAVKPHLTAFVAFCTSFKNLLDRDFPHFSDIMGWMVGVYTKIMQPLTKRLSEAEESELQITLQLMHLTYAFIQKKLSKKVHPEFNANPRVILPR